MDQIGSKSSGRHRRKSPSAIGMVIKTALGGLAAIPIAGVILAMAGKPLPIDLGFYPFLGNSSTTVSSAPAHPRTPAAPSIRNASEPEPTPAPTQIPSGFAMPDSAPATEEPVADPVEADEPVADQPTLADAAITQASRKIDAAIETIQSGSKDRVAIASAYQAVAEAANLLDSQSADSVAVRDLLHTVAGSPMASLYSKVGLKWITSPRRKTDGILLIGKSGSSTEGSVINFPNGQSIVVTSESPLPQGDVVALGKIQGDTNDPVVELIVIETIE